MRNNDLQTELEYFSEDYDEEREMEPRPEPARAVTPPFRAASPRVRRRSKRVVGFEETQNRGESMVERNSEGGRPLEKASRGNGGQNVNLPPLLVAHIRRSENGQPLQSSLTSAYGGQVLPNNVGRNLPPNGEASPTSHKEGTYHRPSQTPMYAFPNMPAYANPNPTGLFPNPLGSVTPFVRWIEDYPLPDGLKMPSHIGSYDGKGDPDNFLHLFEGAIRMQKWLMPVACHMFTYTLKDSARIWWNSRIEGSILDYEDLKAKFRSHFSQQRKFTKTHLAVHNIKQRENESTRAFINRYTNDTLQILGLHEDQRIFGFIHGLRTRSLVKHLSIDLPLTYKGLMEKTYTWVEAREVATNGVSSDQRDSFERPKKSSWDNNRGQKNKDRFSPYRGPNHGLLSNLSKSPREILATERAAKSFEPPPKMFGSKRSRDNLKYCHFHEIQEAINSGQLSHLVKGIKKEKAKSTDTPRGEGKKDKSIAPVEAPILMINREDYAAKNTVSESMAYKEEITFPPVTRVSNAPVIIEAAVFGRKVGRVYMDSGSTCEVIYEHCFEKLNPTIKATRVNTKTSLVGFSGKRSWSVGEVSLEITIGEHPLSRTDSLNFVIVKSDSPHNILLGRTAMQKMGIMVSTIHGAIKFHTKKGFRTVLSVGEAGEETKKAGRTLTISKERIPSCDDTEEKIVVNNKYPEQMVTIGKQLPEHFKKELQNLLRANADIFAWTHVDMTGILRTIMVDGKPFNTEHKLNEYSHIKPIKQNKRSLGPDRNTTACKEAEELMKAGIL
ncbi:reverse transcriptase domain-containing protein [Tanacetum coccineum]|uniref:Reverse transcriptase domain-containing protein n=1 Tax=Tanacetum coccineum TaxID=301880 RepID=A0ABQ5EBX0_9ASTR